VHDYLGQLKRKEMQVDVQMKSRRRDSRCAAEDNTVPPCIEAMVPVMVVVVALQNLSKVTVTMRVVAIKLP
jgi:hypothetical protein